MIVVLFSAYAFSEGLDYKSLFSVNSDKNNRGRGEFMVKSEKRETFAHGAGGDCLGKLALFSTLLRPVDVTDLVTLFEGEVQPKDIPGWKPEFFSAHPGLAVAFGHVTAMCARPAAPALNSRWPLNCDRVVGLTWTGPRHEGQGAQGDGDEQHGALLAEARAARQSAAVEERSCRLLL